MIGHTASLIGLVSLCISGSLFGNIVVGVGVIRYG